MQPGDSAADLVAHLDPEIDRIEGLITVTEKEGMVVALVAARSELKSVRRELIRIGVPERMLQLQLVEETLLPYPITDERLRRWIDESEESGAVDAAVTVKGPGLNLTPRRIGMAFLLLVVGGYVLLMLIFIVLMIYEEWAYP